MKSEKTFSVTTDGGAPALVGKQKVFVKIIEDLIVFYYNYSSRNYNCAKISNSELNNVIDDCQW